jgi:hypothetical protein
MRKSEWGPITWKLIHCISIKANPNLSQEQFNELKNIISRIVSNLPCPYCTSHAIDYLSRTNYKSIRNINDLTLYLFNFHNNVNIRLNKPIITFEEHNTIYTNINTINTVQNFINLYQKNTNNVTMMLYNFHRKKMVYDVYLYFQKNKPLYSL